MDWRDCGCLVPKFFGLWVGLVRQSRAAEHCICDHVLDMCARLLLLPVKFGEWNEDVPRSTKLDENASHSFDLGSISTPASVQPRPPGHLRSS